MSYVDQSRRPSPASMVAVVGVHAAIAAALVAGLTVSGVIVPDDGPLISTEYKLPEPPPPDPVDPVEPKAAPSDPVIHIPQPRLDIKSADPVIPTTPLVFPPLPKPSPGLGTELLKPTPQPGFDPVAAKPRNDPSRWLSDDDYRPSWARRELTGTARFRLEIAASGKVTDCRVTGSTGHAELDQATCALVTRRARFEPARGTSGEPVAGSYAGAVQWELPR